MQPDNNNKNILHKNQFINNILFLFLGYDYYNQYTGYSPDYSYGYGYQSYGAGAGAG